MELVSAHRRKVYATDINSGMSKITRLPEELINQIAAGEVVENPASVVKELIENSLDAGSLRIGIWIEEGGMQLIRIEDDGCGMGEEDALLCLERHATSKIREEADLHHLATMGFRGEALAAIASVSLLELKTSDGVRATSIRTEGGKVLEVLPCARNQGTSVIIRSLFFNVPARKKFMKSASTQRSQVLRVVETIALAHPEVSFTLYAEQKVVLEAPSTTAKKRVESLIGPMPHEVCSAEVKGWLAPAEEAKVHRRGQYLFINRRPIFSPLIAKAVKAGYGTRIAEAAYPSFVLFLTVSPEEVDVNVHPQKKEVRFAQEGKIFRLCERAVATAFDTGHCFLEPLTFMEPVGAYLPCLEKERKDFSFDIQGPSLKAVAEPLFLPLPWEERPLAVIDGFLLVQAEQVIIVDLKAAHARVLATSFQEKVEMQTLMWPLEAVVEEEEMVEELQAIGIDCRWIGKRTLAVDALPSFLDVSDFPMFLESWREERKIDAAVARYVKQIGKRFSLEEAFFLWRQLQKCEEKRYDPSGKKIWEFVDAKRLKRVLEG